MTIFKCPDFSNSEEFLHKIRNPYYLYISIPLLMFALIYLSMKEKVAEPLVPLALLTLIKAILMAASIAAGAFGMINFQQRMKKIDYQVELRVKLCNYYILFMARNLWLGLATLTAVLGLYLTKAQEFTLIFVVFLILFSIGSPTYYRISNSLQLNQDEKDIIYKKKPI